MATEQRTPCICCNYPGFHVTLTQGVRGEKLNLIPLAGWLGIFFPHFYLISKTLKYIKQWQLALLKLK